MKSNEKCYWVLLSEDINTMTKTLTSSCQNKDIYSNQNIDFEAALKAINICCICKKEIRFFDCSYRRFKI
jgi:hypothetical protein